MHMLASTWLMIQLSHQDALPDLGCQIRLRLAPDKVFVNNVDLTSRILHTHMLSTLEVGGVGGNESLAQHHLHTIDLSHKRELSPLSITELSPVTKARGVQVDSVLLNGREVGGQGGVEEGRQEFQFRYVSPLFIFVEKFTATWLSAWNRQLPPA